MAESRVVAGPSDVDGKAASERAVPQLGPGNGRVVEMEDVLYSWRRFATTGSTDALANSANPEAPVLSWKRRLTDAVIKFKSR
jgi:hypothetical protein